MDGCGSSGTAERVTSGFRGTGLSTGNELDRTSAEKPAIPREGSRSPMPQEKETRGHMPRVSVCAVRDSNPEPTD